EGGEGMAFRSAGYSPGMTLTEDLRPSAATDDLDLASLAPAQLVWLRATELDEDDPETALELVRLARSEPSVLQHALTLDRSRTDATDRRSTGAVAAIEAALALVAGRDHAS